MLRQSRWFRQIGAGRVARVEREVVPAEIQQRHHEQPRLAERPCLAQRFEQQTLRSVEISERALDECSVLVHSQHTVRVARIACHCFRLIQPPLRSIRVTLLPARVGEAVEISHLSFASCASVAIGSACSSRASAKATSPQT